MKHSLTFLVYGEVLVLRHTQIKSQLQFKYNLKITSREKGGMNTSINVTSIVIVHLHHHFFLLFKKTGLVLQIGKRQIFILFNYATGRKDFCEISKFIPEPLLT